MMENDDGMYECKMRLLYNKPIVRQTLLHSFRNVVYVQTRTLLHCGSLGRGNRHQNKDFGTHSEILRMFAHAL